MRTTTASCLHAHDRERDIGKYLLSHVSSGSTSASRSSSGGDNSGSSNSSSEASKRQALEDSGVVFY